MCIILVLLYFSIKQQGSLYLYQKNKHKIDYGTQNQSDSLQTSNQDDTTMLKKFNVSTNVFQGRNIISERYCLN